MIVDRLDPALRQFAASRTDLSASVLGVVRDSLNQRRAEAFRDVNTVGVDIENREARSIPVTQMWQHYFAGEPVPADAVPARAAELAGVASILITCSELDPLLDEAVDYAVRLLWAGVATELHVFPGACHGFDSLLPDWETSQHLFELQGTALRRALHHAVSSRAMAAW
jgi:acetyl esterase/lipase